MDNKKLENYRNKVKRADEINLELGRNKSVLVDIELKKRSILNRQCPEGIGFMGKQFNGDTAVEILEKVQLVLNSRNKDLEEEFAAL